MSIFYAYAKNINDNSTYRFTIVFSSRAISDEWWRDVAASSSRFSASIRRVNAQFYTHNPDLAVISNSITDDPTLTKYLGKIFFTLIDDTGGRQLPVLPVINIKDSISGNFFFIRSKSDPSEYWYCPPSSSGNVTPNTSVYVSRTERTRFRVRLASEGTNYKGTIMIGSDEICITLTSANLSINVSSNGDSLIVANSPVPGLKFSDLNNGFKAGGTIARRQEYLAGQYRDELVKELIKSVDGEEWELA